VERLVLGGEADGFSGGTGAARASDSMDIVLRVLRQVVVDHVANALNVNAAPGHIRRYHYPDVARAKVLKRPYPLLLSDFSGEYGTTDAVSTEPFPQSASLIPAVAENENPLEVLLGDQVVQDGKPFPVPDKVQHLFYGIYGHLFGVDLNCSGIVRPLRGKPGHLGCERGTEEHGLPLRLGRGTVYNLPYVGYEAHIEHLVSFVDHQYLDFAQVYVTLSLEIQQPSGGGHNDINRFLRKHVLLFLVIHPAEHGNNPASTVFPQQAGILMDLYRQFACGNHDQSPGHTGTFFLARGTVFQAHEDSDQEGGGLTGTGLCLAGYVCAREGIRQYRGLNRRTVFKPEIVDRMHDLGGQGQVMEARLPFGGRYLKLR
jgi:hypothetical protein